MQMGDHSIRIFEPSCGIADFRYRSDTNLTIHLDLNIL